MVRSWRSCLKEVCQQDQGAPQREATYLGGSTPVDGTCSIEATSAKGRLTKNPTYKERLRY
jgi:hypothetical protein